MAMPIEGPLPMGPHGLRGQASNKGLIHGRGPKPPKGRSVPRKNSMREELVMQSEGIILRLLEGLSSLLRVGLVLKKGETIQRSTGTEDWRRVWLALDVELHRLVDRKRAFVRDPELSNQGEEQGVHEDEVTPAAARGTTGGKARGHGPPLPHPRRMSTKVGPSRLKQQELAEGKSSSSALGSPTMAT